MLNYNLSGFWSTHCIVFLCEDANLFLLPIGERTCSPSQFTCPTWYPGHPRCVPLNSVCDGEKDCANAADELHNCPNRTCHMDEFACANGLCILIPYQWVWNICRSVTGDGYLAGTKSNYPTPPSCDRVNDCGDGSDELNCEYDTCSSSQFTCGNGACIPASYTCDGDNDCLDGSDEADSLCVTPHPTCSPQQYMCKSGECIDLHKVCNEQKDCQDNSDEKGCGESVKLMYFTGLHVTLKLSPKQDTFRGSRFTLIKSIIISSHFEFIHWICSWNFIREMSFRKKFWIRVSVR